MKAKIEREVRGWAEAPASHAVWLPALFAFLIIVVFFAVVFGTAALLVLAGVNPAFGIMVGGLIFAMAFRQAVKKFGP